MIAPKKRKKDNKRKEHKQEFRIGIAQINPTLGDFAENKNKILEYLTKASERKCSILVFPECALFGYHPFDMLENPGLLEQQDRCFQEIVKKIPENLLVIFGLLTRNTKSRGRPYFNSAALLVKGKRPKFFNKQLLPTGDVFDEARFVEPGKMTDNYFSWKGHKFFITICEDIWAWPNSKGKSLYRENPLAQVPRRPVDLVINLSASPFYAGKMMAREYMTQKTAQHFKAPVLYVNLVGAQDEIIFDGASFLILPNGKKVFSCEAFREDFNAFDLLTHSPWACAQPQTKMEDLHRALVLGVGDFCRKVGIDRVHLGLSGGIDSAVVACLAVDALGAKNVVGIGLPGPYSSPLSLKLAKRLARNLGIEFHNVPINSSYRSILSLLKTKFHHGKFNLVNENLQARIRGIILMAFSNQHNSLLLTTGNKSEYATGYTTLYGDMCGGLAPIGDLTKKQVYDLAAYYNSQHALIPNEILTRAPTAELRSGQKDQDSLPPYALLDAAVERVVTQSGRGRSEIDQWLLPILMKTEFKRWQAPPILKVSEHSFGRGRRWPVAHRAWKKN